MIWIEGRHIRVSRGDTARIRIELEDGGALEGAQAAVTVKRRPGDSRALWQKRLTVAQGAVALDLTRADTDHRPGVYWWDLRLTLPDGGVQTAFTPDVFEICEVIGDV